MYGTYGSIHTCILPLDRRRDPIRETLRYYIHTHNSLVFFLLRFVSFPLVFIQFFLALPYSFAVPAIRLTLNHTRERKTERRRSISPCILASLHPCILAFGSPPPPPTPNPLTLTSDLRLAFQNHRLLIYA